MSSKPSTLSFSVMVGSQVEGTTLMVEEATAEEANR
jgi:hypothetical protein